MKHWRKEAEERYDEAEKARKANPVDEGAYQRAKDALASAERQRDTVIAERNSIKEELKALGTCALPGTFCCAPRR